MQLACAVQDLLPLMQLRLPLLSGNHLTLSPRIDLQATKTLQHFFSPLHVFLLSHPVLVRQSFWTQVRDLTFVSPRALSCLVQTPS